MGGAGSKWLISRWWYATCRYWSHTRSAREASACGGRHGATQSRRAHFGNGRYFVIVRSTCWTLPVDTCGGDKTILHQVHITTLRQPLEDTIKSRWLIILAASKQVQVLRLQTSPPSTCFLVDTNLCKISTLLSRRSDCSIWLRLASWMFLQDSPKICTFELWYDANNNKFLFPPNVYLFIEFIVETELGICQIIT